MFRGRLPGVGWLHGMLWLGLALSPASPRAHTMREIEQVCPLDKVKFKATMDMSGTSFGMRLDLRPIGPTPAPWRLAVCPKDHFVLFKDEFSPEEIEQLKKFVNTPQYQEMGKSESSYFLVGQIFEYLKKDDSTIGHVLLKATWQVEGDAAKYRRYAEASLQHFKSFLAAPKLPNKSDTADKPSKKEKKSPEDSENERITAELVAGELERRLEKFDDAKARFTRIATQTEYKKKDIFPRIIEYQLQLIAQKDSSPQQIPSDEKSK